MVTTRSFLAAVYILGVTGAAPRIAVVNADPRKPLFLFDHPDAAKALAKYFVDRDAVGELAAGFESTRKDGAK